LAASFKPNGTGQKETECGDIYFLIAFSFLAGLAKREERAQSAATLQVCVYISIINEDRCDSLSIWSSKARHKSKPVDKYWM
jgi:hypothetical protein